jgi:hypothetical protein
MGNLVQLDEGGRIAHLTGHTGAKEMASTSRAYTNAVLGGTGGAAAEHGRLALHHGNEATRAMTEGRFADMAHHQGLAREHARAVLGSRRGAR